MWVGPTQSVEGPNRKRPSQEKEETPAADCLWAQSAALPWPRLYPADLGLTNLHNHVNQILKIYQERSYITDLYPSIYLSVNIYEIVLSTHM